MSDTSTALPGLTAGTWKIDPVHSEVSFSVRHLMVSKVRGHFKEFSGTITVGDSLANTKLEASVELASVDTRDEGRDNHLRSGDFFDADNYKTMTYESTKITANGDEITIEGNLNLHGVTRPVPFTVEFNGTSTDPWGGSRAGFSAEGEISRGDFSIDFNTPLDGGGVVVGDRIKISLEIEAVLQADA